MKRAYSQLESTKKVSQDEDFERAIETSEDLEKTGKRWDEHHSYIENSLPDHSL
jgi:hypothetical protein